MSDESKSSGPSMGTVTWVVIITVMTLSNCSNEPKDRAKMFTENQIRELIRNEVLKTKNK